MLLWYGHQSKDDILLRLKTSPSLSFLQSQKKCWDWWLPTTTAWVPTRSIRSLPRKTTKYKEYSNISETRPRNRTLLLSNCSKSSKSKKWTKCRTISLKIKSNACWIVSLRRSPIPKRKWRRVRSDHVIYLTYWAIIGIFIQFARV